MFNAFNLEDHVPANPLLRGIDRFLDLDGLHQHLSSRYSHTGRSSIDPALLIPPSLSLFCRLGLEDAVPDLSTFSKNRHGRFRDNDTLLRRV